MTDTPTTPYDRIEAKRTGLGWSQREACRQAGVNETALAVAKRNDGRLELTTIQGFATAFGCPVSELLGEAVPATNTLAQFADSGTLPLHLIINSPLNPRKTFNEDALSDLADSIASQGLLQNLVVRHNSAGDGTFVLVAGERRWRAMNKLSAEQRLPEDLQRGIPCRVLSADDAQHLALALMENLQREEVNPMEEAEGFAQLQTLDPATYTTTAIAEKLGKTGKAGQRYVQQRLALVEKLLPEAQDALREGKISFTMARQLTMAPMAYQKAAAKNLTGFKSASDIRMFLTKDMVPVDKAFFAVEGCGLEIVEDPESGDRYFTDKKAFLAEQKTAVATKVAELGQEWAWAKELDYFSEWQYPDRTEDRAEGGAIVVLRGYDMTVEVYTGLVKRPEVESTGDPAREAERREEEARKKDATEAAEDFADRLRIAIRENPQTAGRVLLLLPVLTPHPDVEFSFRNYRGVRKDGVNGGVWSFLGGFVGQADSEGVQVLKPTGNLADVLKASRDLSPQQAIHCTASLVASMWNPRLDWKSHKIDRFSIAMASLYDVEIPAILLPDIMDQLDERASHANSAEEVAEILLEAIAIRGNARWGRPPEYRASLDMSFDELGIDLDPSPLVEKLFGIELAKVDWKNRTISHVVALICRENGIGDQDEDGPLTVLAKEFADAVTSTPARVRQVLRDLLVMEDDNTSLPDDGEALADLVQDHETTTELAEALQGEFNLPSPPFNPANCSMEDMGLGTVGELIAFIAKRVAASAEIPDELDDGAGIDDDEEAA